MASYEGHCHCGAVRFRIESDFEGFRRCNCSLCIRRSAVMHYVTPERFELVSGADVLREYRFSSGSTAHRFCSVCGIFTHFESRYGRHHFAVNVACIDGVDPYAFDAPVFDGASIPFAE
jgi:hypothetical protein